jgi:hypothetical protein
MGKKIKLRSRLNWPDDPAVLAYPFENNSKRFPGWIYNVQAGGRSQSAVGSCR